MWFEPNTVRLSKAELGLITLAIGIVSNLFRATLILNSGNLRACYVRAASYSNFEGSTLRIFRQYTLRLHTYKEYEINLSLL